MNNSVKKIGLVLILASFGFGFGAPPPDIHIQSFEVTPDQTKIGSQMTAQITAIDTRDGKLEYQWSITPQVSKVTYENHVAVEKKFPEFIDYIDYSKLGDSQNMPNKKYIHSEIPGQFIVKCLVIGEQSFFKEAQQEIRFNP